MTSVQGVEMSVMLPSGSNHLLLSVFLAENCSNRVIPFVGKFSQEMNLEQKLLDVTSM